MKKKRNVFSFLGLLVIGLLSITLLNAYETEASSVQAEAIITNNNGIVINDSIVSLDDEEYYRTNSTTIATNSPVIGRKIIVTLSGKIYGLPGTIYYTKYQPGYAIPFQSRLSLSNTYGTGNNVYGIYTGNALSFLI